MLGPLFQHKLRLAVLMLASALIFLAEPVFARKDNRASSSAREDTQQQAASQPAAPTPAPVPSPAPAPAARIQQSSSSVSRPTVQTQSRNAASIPSTSVRPQSSTQSRVITSSPSVSAPSRNVITNTKPSQPQTSSQNTISTNRSVSSRNTRQSNDSVTPPLNSVRQPVENVRSRSSLDRANTDLGVMIGPERTPSRDSRQPAANPNDRTTRDRSSIGTQIGEQDNSTSRTQIRNYVGDLERTNSSIGDSAKPRERTERVDSQARDISRGTVGDINTRVDRRVERPQVESGRSSDDSLSRTRISRDAPDTQTAIAEDLHVRDSDGRRDLRTHRYEPVRPKRIIVRDRPYTRGPYRDNYIYMDLHNRAYTRTITPDYYFRICYGRGSWLTFRYVYPYYQRKYVFVSLGGFWPSNYSYIRYYWYGVHPYNWYGYYPVAREVGSDVNYYTYNYYYGDNSTGYDTGRVLDSEYFDTTVRQPAPQPAEATLADTYFDEAVNAFEKGKYDLAMEKFSRAMELAPDDMILPYAYSQSLFAAERYSEAAQVLRKALSKVKPEQEGVFYPRGLYPNDDELLAQLDKLAEYVEEYSFDADLQLLLGYQLLGIGELDKALTPLRNASLDMNNQKPADVLLNLLLKIKVNDITSGENIEPEKIDSDEIEPDTIQLNKAEPVIRDVQNFTFLASENSAPVVKKENEAAEITDSKIVSEVISANEPTNKKAKEGILLATLFVLAGSTGLGHFLHR